MFCFMLSYENGGYKAPAFASRIHAGEVQEMTLVNRKLLEEDAYVLKMRSRLQSGLSSVLAFPFLNRKFSYFAFK